MKKKRDGNHYAPLFIVVSKSEQVEGGQDPVTIPTLQLRKKFIKINGSVIFEIEAKFCQYNNYLLCRINKMAQLHPSSSC